MGLMKRLGALSLKALTGKVRFPGRSLVWFNLDRPDKEDFLESVGDGTSSDVLMTPVRWLQRAIVEASFVAKDEKGELIKEPSDLVDLLKRPNPFYAGDVLLAGTVLSLSLDGNAYWVIALNRDGRPVELWYAPHGNVEPRWPDDNTANKFITHYEYKVKGAVDKIQPAGSDDVTDGVVKGLAMVHFREGVDLNNLRKGLSPMKGLLREIWTDNEAAAFTAALLRNNCIPGIVLSPSDPSAVMTPDEGKIAKEKLLEEYTREKRGMPLVMLGPTRVEQFGFSPKDMDLSLLRDVSEERVTAALGVPAAVVGFGAGLQQTKVGATMRELRQLAWTNGVIPLQRIIAGEVTRSLAKVFDVNSVEFDNSGVEALRENQDAKAARVERLVRAGVMTRGEGRAALGLEVTDADRVYLLSLAVIEVPLGRAPLKAEHSLLKALSEKEHSHGAVEDAIIDAAPSRPSTAVAARMARRLDVIRRSAGAALQGPLTNAFEAMGRRALTAARAAELDAGDAGDGVLVETLLADMDIAAARVDLQEAMEEGYLVVAGQVSAVIGSTLGVVVVPPKHQKQAIETTFVLSDAAQREVLRAGGLRAGLIDLDAQTREALFDALAEGRAEGLTSDNLARRIRDHVEAGPWRDAATRARVIARTEGAHAANVSTLQAARSMPETEHVQIFDDRIGFGDPLCSAPEGANGRIITIDEAEAIGLAHPNCTRSFVPINSLLMEEMGL